ncbi:MAG: hypothetical protein U5N26_03575 [Candidatus Marinimicrobia bacterium]|nr:hypothetical protein [Candidatus Neomarinimicrobiota bacterium]
MTGIDLARLNMQAHSFGLDSILRGMSLGAQYRLNSITFSLGLYHYANFSTMTAWAFPGTENSTFPLPCFFVSLLIFFFSVEKTAAAGRCIPFP